MPNRIIRDGLLTSDSWLRLHDNTARVAYFTLLLKADEYGNHAASNERLMREWRDFGVQSPEHAAKILADLLDNELVALYVVEGRRYLHINRFRQRVRYRFHRVPASPWDESEHNQDDAENRSDPSPPRVGPESVPSRPEVEVEVEVEVDKSSSKALVVANAPPLALESPEANPKAKTKARATRLPDGWTLPDDWKAWAVAAYHMDPQKVVRISLDFRDYWHAKSGKDSTKLDWLATWRRWIRRANGDA